MLVFCVQVRGSKKVSCHAGTQEVSRCFTRGESEECITHKWGSTQVRYRIHYGFVKPRADITRSPKLGYQWPHKKDWCPQRIIFKNCCEQNAKCRKFLRTETNILSPENALVVTLPVGVRSWHPHEVVYMVTVVTSASWSHPLLKSLVTMGTDCIIVLDVRTYFSLGWWTADWVVLVPVKTINECKGYTCIYVSIYL